MTFKEGILFGKKILFDEADLVLEEAFYDDTGLSGRYFLKSLEGQEIVSFYKNNKLEGLHQIFYSEGPNGEKVKALEALYQEGLIHGELAEYNLAGIKISSTYFEKGIKEGPKTFYFNTGTIYKED